LKEELAILKKKVFFWAGIIVSFLFLYLFLFGLNFTFHGKKVFYPGINFGEVGKAMGNANYFYILPYYILYMLAFVIRAARWRYFMEPIKKISFSSIFSVTFIGFMGNCILPARAGEVVRPVLIGMKEKVSKSASFATIVIERVFDMVTILLFSGLILIFFKFPSDFEAGIGKSLRAAGIGIAGMTLLLVIFLILLKEKTEQVLRIIKKIFSVLPEALGNKLIKFIESFIDGLGILSNFKNLTLSALLSISLWIVFAMSAYVMLPAFGIKLPFSSGFLIIVINALGVALPSSPGFIGVYQVSIEIALKIMNVTDVSNSKSYAITLWALNMIFTIIIGMFFLWKENLTFKDIKKSGEDSGD